MGQIVDLATQPDSVLEQAALLLVEEFNGPQGWATIETARQEAAAVVRDGFARAMMEDGVLLG